jgi:hypothetical protein
MAYDADGISHYREAYSVAFLTPWAGIVAVLGACLMPRAKRPTMRPKCRPSSRPGHRLLGVNPHPDLAV